MNATDSTDLVSALVHEGLLTSRQAEQIQQEAVSSEKRLEEILIDQTYLTDEQCLAFKGRFYHQPTVDLATFSIASDAINAIPEELARDHILIPLLKDAETITVALADPLDMEAIDAVERFVGCRVKTVLSTVKDIQRAIELSFGVERKIEALLQQTERDRLEYDNAAATSTQAVDLAAVEGPIAGIIRLTIVQAVNMGASDIHLEPLETRLRVRMRVDGLLQEVLSFEKIYQSALISSAKIICSMDIAEKRVPQDGRFRIVIHKRPIDLRASTFPAMHGEKFVFRILDKENANIDLSQLGIEGKTFERLNSLIRQPLGVFLVTGPTGSGKTTTLYSILKEINTPLVNVVTLEDPVEFDLDTVNQGQVNVKAGLSFAKGLRAIMRQDPDIVMIGEIRDKETAEIATQAALTGHLVLSTLHTNDAPGTIARLIDMEVEPFLVASSLSGVLTQRLARRLCPKCKQDYQPSEELLRHFDLPLRSDYQFYKPVGCRECGRTGYRGRMGIFEFMPISDAIRALITAQASTMEIRKQALAEGMLTLQMYSMQKVIAGTTSVEETLRIAGGEEV